MTLLNKGEGILVGEWTYPAALATATSFGVSPVPIAIDGQGIQSDHLRKVLSEWDENARCMPRPHVMYIIPVGQVIGQFLFPMTVPFTDRRSALKNPSGAVSFFSISVMPGLTFSLDHGL
jgi:hypothetical protein